MTRMECSASISLSNARSSLAMSSKCRPVVGSSNTNNLPRGCFASSGLMRLGSAEIGRESTLSARCPASFKRCASPPDSVGTGCPRRT